MQGDPCTWGLIVHFGLQIYDRGQCCPMWERSFFEWFPVPPVIGRKVDLLRPPPHGCNPCWTSIVGEASGCTASALFCPRLRCCSGVLAWISSHKPLLSPGVRFAVFRSPNSLLRGKEGREVRAYQDKTPLTPLQNPPK